VPCEPVLAPKPFNTNGQLKTNNSCGAYDELEKNIALGPILRCWPVFVELRFTQGMTSSNHSNSLLFGLASKLGWSKIILDKIFCLRQAFTVFEKGRWILEVGDQPT